MLSLTPSNQPYTNEHDSVLEIRGHRPWMADGITTIRPVRGRGLNNNGMDTTRHRGFASFPRSTCPCLCKRRRQHPIHSVGDIHGNVHTGVVADIDHDTSGRHPAHIDRIAGRAKVAHPTNGEVVVVDVLRGWWWWLQWHGGWSVWGDHPPCQTCHEHVLSVSCQEGDTGMLRPNHDWGYGTRILDDIATQILNLRNPGSLVNFIANIILDF